jgi:ABC-type transport system involved in multi-copper enzyme maturation permease subunit
VGELDEIRVIWRGELQRALRSGWAAALAVLFLVGQGLLLAVVGFLSSGAAKMTGPASAGGDTLAQKKALLTFFSSYSEATIDSIARLPTVLLVAFSATTLVAPLLIALMGFDQLAGEVAPKSMRYLIVRARRTSIVTGKYLTQLTVLLVLLALCVVAMVGTARGLDADFGWADTFGWGLKLVLALGVVGVTYAALTTLCSALAPNGALALFLNIGVLFSFWLVSLLSNRVRLPDTAGAVGLEASKEESLLAYLRYLVPSEFEHRLLSPDALEYATGLVAYLGFALVFLALARLALQRRDL